jgi:hypothetical protein
LNFKSWWLKRETPATPPGSFHAADDRSSTQENAAQTIGDQGVCKSFEVYKRNAALKCIFANFWGASTLE